MLERFVRGTLPYLRRHLERLLAIREKIQINEETLHLLLAGVVGVLGGLVNLLFYAAVEAVMRFALHGTGEVVEIAEVMSWWERLLIPTLGGLAAGLILYWGL
ncbi:MAG TPA: hypothetical protein VK633_11330, partial [Verrucomicrobiae bacterium]|nr:hypothetical protein [Verrucomicrobiae bacterium]